MTDDQRCEETADERFRRHLADAEKMADEIDPALREIGIDPDEIAKVPLFRAMIRIYVTGRWTKKQLLAKAHKIAIIKGWVNPA